MIIMKKTEVVPADLDALFIVTCHRQQLCKADFTSLQTPTSYLKLMPCLVGVRVFCRFRLNMTSYISLIFLSDIPSLS